MYESVAKLPCGEVTVAKLPCGEVTGNHFCGSFEYFRILSTGMHRVLKFVLVLEMSYKILFALFNFVLLDLFFFKVSISPKIPVTEV